jgi:hypothetical protein
LVQCLLLSTLRWLQALEWIVVEDPLYCHPFQMQVVTAVNGSLITSFHYHVTIVLTYSSQICVQFCPTYLRRWIQKKVCNNYERKKFW